MVLCEDTVKKNRKSWHSAEHTMTESDYALLSYLEILVPVSRPIDTDNEDGIESLYLE